MSLVLFSPWEFLLKVPENWPWNRVFMCAIFLGSLDLLEWHDCVVACLCTLQMIALSLWSASEDTMAPPNGLAWKSPLSLSAMAKRWHEGQLWDERSAEATRQNNLPVLVSFSCSTFCTNLSIWKLLQRLKTVNHVVQRMCDKHCMKRPLFCKQDKT